MKVTTELLKRYGSCQEGIDFLENNFPNGAEALEIAKVPNLPISFLFFAQKYFSLNKEEYKKYEELCNLVNSKHILASHNIENCEFVANSSYVSDSKYVFNSTNVHDSRQVYSGVEIKSSKNINLCVRVNNSDRIINSDDVVDSFQVVGSNLITWCKQILDSFIARDCDFIYRGNNIEDCYFCGFIKNSKHCIFCFGIENEEYCIFNEKVDRALFEQIKEQLLFELEAETPTFVQINGDKKAREEERFVYNHRYDSIFNGLSKEFYGWISTIPYYDDDKFLSLFFRNREEFEN